MNNESPQPLTARAPVLSAVDRVSEMVFGLLMALTFVGALSVSSAGREDIRAMFTAALGCNLAWGLVDAVMYLVRTIAERGRTLALLRTVRAAAPLEGRNLIQQSLSQAAAALVTTAEVEALRQRMLAIPELPERARLQSEDLVAALAVFLLVVVATFPVVLPFLLLHDIGAAMNLSRLIAVAMLFVGGLALGRYAGFSSWAAGLGMAGLGAALVLAIRALGG